MIGRKSQEEASLLDVLIDGFEKNEILHGFHWRNLPMPDVPAANRKFDALAEEARKWKGEPVREQTSSVRRIVAWPDLEIRQSGRAIMVRASAPWFSDWWQASKTWEDDPMQDLYAWLEEERSSHAREG
jgi:hypothetical protein